jgi:hypothetical protein
MIILLTITLVLGWISLMSWFITKLSPQKAKTVTAFVFGIFDRFPITAIAKTIKKIKCRNNKT